MTCVYSSRQDTESEPFLEAKFASQREAEEFAEGWNAFYPTGNIYFFCQPCTF